MSELAAGETEPIPNDIVLQHPHPEDPIIYLDGSVIREKKVVEALLYTFLEI
jgi:hypothetical protein